MNAEKIIAILKDIQYRRWKFRFDEDGMWLQVQFLDRQLQPQIGRKWRLSKFMTRSEVVQTALMAVIAAEEHETREHFLYKGAAIFGPHHNVEDLVAIARTGKPDVREKE